MLQNVRTKMPSWQHCKGKRFSNESFYEVLVIICLKKIWTKQCYKNSK